MAFNGDRNCSTLIHRHSRTLTTKRENQERTLPQGRVFIGSDAYGRPRFQNCSFLSEIAMPFTYWLLVENVKLTVAKTYEVAFPALSSPLSGNFNDSSANNQGSNGNFWSSTYNSATNMYNLNVNATNVNPQNNNNRNNGFSVRCVYDGS